MLSCRKVKIFSCPLTCDSCVPMNRLSSRSPWLLVSAAVLCALALAVVANVAGVPHQLQLWLLPFGQSADIYCFFFLPLWFFAALTGTPFIRGVAWFALSVSATIGGTLYLEYPLSNVSWLMTTLVVTTSLPVALLYLWPKHTPDLISRFTMAKMLVMILIVLSTSDFLRITSYFGPTIDYRIVFLENLLHLTGYLGNTADVDTENYLRRAIRLVYFFIPSFIMLFLIYLKRKHPASPFFSSYILSIITGISLYGFAPAVGPAAVFYVLPDTQLHAISWDLLYFPTGDLPRNAMPSLHTTWSLLMIFCCLHLRGGLRFFFILIALTSAAGTMTTYNHWLIDLGMAFPLSIACLCVNSYFQTRNRNVAGLLLVCSLLLLFWFMLFISPTPPLFGAGVLWLALTATVLMPLIGLWTLRQEILDPAEASPRQIVGLPEESIR